MPGTTFLVPLQKSDGRLDGKPVTLLFVDKAHIVPLDGTDRLAIMK